MEILDNQLPVYTSVLTVRDMPYLHAKSPGEIDCCQGNLLNKSDLTGHALLFSSPANLTRR